MSPLATSSPTTASPRSFWKAARMPWRSSSTGGGASAPSAGSAGCSVSVSGADDNGVSAPTFGRILVADPFLQQHDALEERLGAGRAAGDVHVDRDDLVDALGHRGAVPIGAAAVGAA